MEPNYDWKSFRELFLDSTRVPGRELLKPPHTPNSKFEIFSIVEGDVLLAAYAEGEDFSDWVGARVSELQAQFPKAHFRLVPRESLERNVTEAIALPQYYEQLSFLGSNPKGHLPVSHSPPHFLLRAIRSWWKKVFPVSYGVFIRLEGEKARDFVLVVRGGKLESFYSPDLRYLGAERLRNPAEATRGVSEKLTLPTLGIVVSSQLWAAWSQSPNPWRDILRAFYKGQFKMLPVKPGLTALLILRAFLGL